MGIWSKSCSCKPKYIEVSNNPNPKNFKFIAVEEYNGYLLAKINYPDAKNFEGNKILLYKGVTLITLVNSKELDPHFSDKKGSLSPIARFAPTEDGWNMGLKLMGVK